MFELVIFFALALGVSAVCSLTEAAFLTLGRADLTRMVDEGRPYGAALRKMKANADRSLAAILAVNTLANTVGAAGVGSSAGRIWGSAGMAVASGLLTIAILVFGEVLPKTVGARFASRVAGFVAAGIGIMTILAYPLVVVLQRITRLFGEGPSEQVTRQDVILYAKMGHTDGALDAPDAEAVERILHLRHLPVRDILVPWDQVRALSANDSVGGVVGSGTPLDHVRFPVCAGPSNVVGIVERHRIYESLARGHGDRTLADLADPVRRVPAAAQVDEAFRDATTNKILDLVVVDDDAGRPMGLASPEDVFGHVFGIDV